MQKIPPSILSALIHAQTHANALTGFGPINTMSYPHSAGKGVKANQRKARKNAAQKRAKKLGHY